MYRVTVSMGGPVTRHEFTNERSARAYYEQAKQRGVATFERIEVGRVGRVSNRDVKLEAYYNNELRKWVDAVNRRDLEATKRIEKSLVKLQKQALACGCYETLTKQRRAIK